MVPAVLNPVNSSFDNCHFESIASQFRVLQNSKVHNSGHQRNVHDSSKQTLDFRFTDSRSSLNDPFYSSRTKNRQPKVKFTSKMFSPGGRFPQLHQQAYPDVQNQHQSISPMENMQFARSNHRNSIL